MRKTTQSVLLRASPKIHLRGAPQRGTPLGPAFGLALAVTLAAASSLAGSGLARAQEAEEGPVELDAPASAEPAAPAAPLQSATPSPAYTPESSEVPGEKRESSGTGPGNLRVFLGARLGVGGGFRPKDQGVIYAARVTPGFQAGADYVLFRYFALGGETRFDWASINDRSKFMFWSLMVKPRVRHQLTNLPLEIYAALPGGLSITNSAQSGQTGKASGMLGISAGANYFFGDHWGFNAELGWTWHWQRFEGQIGGTVNGQPAFVKTEYKARFGQMALALNAVYAF